MARTYPLKYANIEIPPVLSLTDVFCRFFENAATNRFKINSVYFRNTGEANWKAEFPLPPGWRYRAFTGVNAGFGLYRDLPTSSTFDEVSRALPVYLSKSENGLRVPSVIATIFTYSSYPTSIDPQPQGRFVDLSFSKVASPYIEARPVSGLLATAVGLYYMDTLSTSFERVQLLENIVGVTLLGYTQGVVATLTGSSLRLYLWDNINSAFLVELGVVSTSCFEFYGMYTTGASDTDYVLFYSDAANNIRVAAGEYTNTLPTVSATRIIMSTTLPPHIVLANNGVVGMSNDTSQVFYLGNNVLTRAGMASLTVASVNITTGGTAPIAPDPAGTKIYNVMANGNLVSLDPSDLLNGWNTEIASASTSSIGTTNFIAYPLAAYGRSTWLALNRDTGQFSWRNITTFQQETDMLDILQPFSSGTNVFWKASTMRYTVIFYSANNTTWIPPSTSVTPKILQTSSRLLEGKPAATGTSVKQQQNAFAVQAIKSKPFENGLTVDAGVSTFVVTGGVFEPLGVAGWTRTVPFSGAVQFTQDVFGVGVGADSVLRDMVLDVSTGVQSSLNLFTVFDMSAIPLTLVGSERVTAVCTSFAGDTMFVAACTGDGSQLGGTTARVLRYSVSSSGTISYVDDYLPPRNDLGIITSVASTTSSIVFVSLGITGAHTLRMYNFNSRLDYPSSDTDYSTDLQAGSAPTLTAVGLNAFLVTTVESNGTYNLLRVIETGHIPEFAAPIQVSPVATYTPSVVQTSPSGYGLCWMNRCTEFVAIPPALMTTSNPTTGNYLDWLDAYTFSIRGVTSDFVVAGMGGEYMYAIDEDGVSIARYKFEGAYNPNGEPGQWERWVQFTEQGVEVTQIAPTSAVGISFLGIWRRNGNYYLIDFNVAGPQAFVTTGPQVSANARLVSNSSGTVILFDDTYVGHYRPNQISTRYLIDLLTNDTPTPTPTPTATETPTPVPEESDDSTWLVIGILFIVLTAILISAVIGLVVRAKKSKA